MEPQKKWETAEVQMQNIGYSWVVGGGIGRLMLRVSKGLIILLKLVDGLILKWNLALKNSSKIYEETLTIQLKAGERNSGEEGPSGLLTHLYLAQHIGADDGQGVLAEAQGMKSRKT